MTFADVKLGDEVVHPLFPEQPCRIVRKDEMVIALERGKSDRIPSSFYSAEFG